METVDQRALNPLTFPQNTIITKNIEENEEQTTASSEKLNPRSKRICKRRNKYQKIDNDIRQKLIDAVQKEGQMLKTAAKKYNVNYSSAKSIFHTYRKEGRIDKKAVRERYLRKYPQSLQNTMLSQSDSESTSVTNNSPKQLLFDPSKIDLQKSLKILQETQALNLSTGIKNSQFKPFNPAFDPSMFLKMTSINPQIDYTSLINPLSLQNPNLRQHFFNQANTMRLYEELAQAKKLQMMLTTSFSKNFEKKPMEENVNPLVNQINMMTSQNGRQTMQNSLFGLGNIDKQILANMGAVSFMNGTQNSGFNSSKNVSK